MFDFGTNRRFLMLAPLDLCLRTGRVTYVEGAPTETAKGLCLYSIDTGLFYGDREFRDGYYDFDNQSVFTINAMDGTVIDREYVY